MYPHVSNSLALVQCGLQHDTFDRSGGMCGELEFWLITSGMQVGYGSESSDEEGFFFFFENQII